jgi:hypothetical protein
MQSPLKKGGPCRQHGPNPPNPLRHSNNSKSLVVQQFCAPGLIWRGYEREASRLFAEFWRTAQSRHLAAFTRHIRAMRALAGRRVR